MESTNISSFTYAMRQLVMIHISGVFLLKSKENRILGILSEDTKSWTTHLQVKMKDWEGQIYNRFTTIGRKAFRSTGHNLIHGSKPNVMLYCRPISDTHSFTVKIYSSVYSNKKRLVIGKYFQEECFWDPLKSL